MSVEQELAECRQYAVEALAELAAAKREISVLQDAVVSYGDRVRMAMAHTPELQQAIDRAFDREGGR